MDHDWAQIAGELEQLLKLRTIPFAMKLYEDRAEMEAIPRVRRPQAVHTLDQLVARLAPRLDGRRHLGGPGRRRSAARWSASAGAK